MVQSLIRDDLLQPSVLVFQLTQLLHVRRQHPSVLSLPIEIRRLADPSRPKNLSNWRAFFALLDNERLCGHVNLDAFIVIRSSPSQGKSSGKL